MSGTTQSGAGALPGLIAPEPGVLLRAARVGRRVGRCPWVPQPRNSRPAGRVILDLHVVVGIDLVVGDGQRVDGLVVVQTPSSCLREGSDLSISIALISVLAEAVAEPVYEVS